MKLQFKNINIHSLRIKSSGLYPIQFVNTETKQQ